MTSPDNDDEATTAASQSLQLPPDREENVKTDNTTSSSSEEMSVLNNYYYYQNHIHNYDNLSHVYHHHHYYHSNKTHSELAANTNTSILENETANASTNPVDTQKSSRISTLQAEATAPLENISEIPGSSEENVPATEASKITTPLEVTAESQDPLTHEMLATESLGQKTNLPTSENNHNQATHVHHIHHHHY